MTENKFEWHEAKNLKNVEAHGVSFYEAQYAFLDENRVMPKMFLIARRNFVTLCFGQDQDKTGILTVRFT